VQKCYQVVGSDVTTEVVDLIKDIGFKYATKSGVTIAVSDITVPPEKVEIVGHTEEEVADVDKQYRRGLLTEQEKTDREIELWTKARDDVATAVKAFLDPFGSLAVMAKSGATKGGFGPIAQLAGMRGLMADPSGRIIPLPIRSNFREGLRVLEYLSRRTVLARVWPIRPSVRQTLVPDPPFGRCGARRHHQRNRLRYRSRYLDPSQGRCGWSTIVRPNFWSYGGCPRG